MTETTTPEPEWLTSLRRDMRTKIGGLPNSSPLTDIADRAADVAASYLSPLHEEPAGLARLVATLKKSTAELEAVAVAARGTAMALGAVGAEQRQRERARDRRIAELEEGVRALGGDPDHMEDPAEGSVPAPVVRESSYGACGNPGCTDCRPLFDAGNNPIPGTDTEGPLPPSRS